MEPNEFTELDVISSWRTADMQMLRDITRTEQGEKLINFQENIVRHWFNSISLDGLHYSDV